MHTCAYTRTHKQGDMYAYTYTQAHTRTHLKISHRHLVLSFGISAVLTCVFAKRLVAVESDCLSGLFIKITTDA